MSTNEGEYFDFILLLKFIFVYLYIDSDLMNVNENV